MVQSTAEKHPPGKKQDPNSSSSPSGQPRAEQARRRSWRRRAQGSGSRTVKPIRLNRVPLLRAETSSPSTAQHHQGVPGLSQGVVPVSSSPGFPRQKQSLKRGHPEGATEPQTAGSPAAKRRRIDDVLARSIETGSSSSTSQVALRLPQETSSSIQSPSRQAAPYRPPWLFAGSMKDKRPQPGPIRMRHVWRQQRREKKPYDRPENQSRIRQASPPAARPPQRSK